MLKDLHSTISSLLSVNDCCILGSSLDIWGHSCRIDDLDCSFSLKVNPESDIDVGLKDYKGVKDNTNYIGNRITVKNLNGRRVEVYDFPKDNIFMGVKFPYYSKETGMIYGDFEQALRMYIMRKLHKVVKDKSLPKKVRKLYLKTFMFQWSPLLELNISHSYDGVNFTRFTN